MYCSEDGGNITIQKRANATEWENQQNGCIKYICDNMTGPVIESKCEENETCINNKCSGPIESELEIKIDIVDSNVTLLDVNMTELTNSLSELSGVDIDNMKIGIKTDASGIIVSIIVYANNKDTADTIAKSLTDLDCNNSASSGDSSND